MIGRISLAAGLLAIFAPVLGAQPATGSRPTLRAPRLIPDSALLSLSRIPRYADGYEQPARVRLRFEPFTSQSRDESASAPRLPTRVTELPRCPMSVQRADSTHDPMPVAIPDSTKKYFIRVAPTGCVAEDTR